MPQISAGNSPQKIQASPKMPGQDLVEEPPPPPAVSISFFELLKDQMLEC